VVFDEAMWFSMKKLQVAFKNEKTCHKKNTNKSFLTSRNTSLTLIKDIFPKSVPPLEIIHLKKQMNPSYLLFLDLPLFAIISTRAFTTPKLATRKSSRIARAPLSLVDFTRIVAIDEPLMWQEVLIR
jgi:hypothetical protein